MQRDFQTWHTKKSVLEHKLTQTFFHEREVWWCALGANIGFEQDGKGKDFARPVLIFRKFNNNVFLALPLTTKAKVGKFYHPVTLGDDMQRRVILSQLRLVDGKRLLDKISVVSKAEFSQIKKATIALLQ